MGDSQIMVSTTEVEGGKDTGRGKKNSLGMSLKDREHIRVKIISFRKLGRRD